MSSIPGSALYDFDVNGLGYAVIELYSSIVRTEVLDIGAEGDLLLVELYAGLLSDSVSDIGGSLKQ